MTYRMLLLAALECVENPERDALTLLASLVDQRPELNRFTAMVEEAGENSDFLHLVRPPHEPAPALAQR